jgi:hypothetical protein
MTTWRWYRGPDGHLHHEAAPYAACVTVKMGLLVPAPSAGTCVSPTTPICASEEHLSAQGVVRCRFMPRSRRCARLLQTDCGAPRSAFCPNVSSSDPLLATVNTSEPLQDDSFHGLPKPFVQACLDGLIQITAMRLAVRPTYQGQLPAVMSSRLSTIDPEPPAGICMSLHEADAHSTLACRGAVSATRQLHLPGCASTQTRLLAHRRCQPPCGADIMLTLAKSADWLL